MNPLDIIKASTPGLLTTPTQSGASAEGNDAGTGVEQPWGVQTSVSPSGLEIHYQAGPKRLYRVKAPIGLSEGVWEYSDAQEVPSVSTVTGVLFKPLENWGMKVGVRGAIEVLHEAPEAWTQKAMELEHDEFVAALLAEMKERKLTVYYETQRAQNRGTSVHRALEAWAETGSIPNPEFYPETERGYVAGFVAFLNDAHPTAIYSELMVGSAEHGYAGRYDLFANLDFAGNVVTKLYPKKAPKRENVGGTWLIDAKTSSGVWDSYKVQIAGYEAAMIEGGYPAPDHKGVLRLTNDGQYELVESLATAEDFLAVLGAYRAVKGLK